MNDHSRYVELAALAAGGHLSEEDLKELYQHTETCTDCKNAAAELRQLVRFHLPLTQNRVRQHINTMMTRPDPGARERFIRRASLEGITFSPEVKSLAPARVQTLSFAAAGAGVFVVIVIAVLYGSQHLNQPFHPVDSRDTTQARQQLDNLTQQNSSLNATISRLEHTLAEQQREIENLRTQVTTLTVAANNSSYDKEQIRAEVTRPASHNAQSLDEAEAQQKTQEKLLADTRTELARLTQTRASDQATIVADQVHLNELSEQLKAAKTNIDMQRQLATAGRDVRDLMGAGSCMSLTFAIPIPMERQAGPSVAYF
jgi:predicted RNase H-like nuclease (RuvC/YqgF family)